METGQDYSGIKISFDLQQLEILNLAPLLNNVKKLLDS